MQTYTHNFLSAQAWEELNKKLENWTNANTASSSTGDGSLKLIIAHINSLATTAYTCVSNDNDNIYVCEVEKLLFGTLFENLTKEDVASMAVSGRGIDGFLPESWFNQVTSVKAPMTIKEWIIANGNSELIILLICKILSELSLEEGLSFFKENIALIRAKLSPSSLGYILSKLPIEAYKEFINLLGGNIFLTGLIKNSGDLGEVLSKLPIEAYKPFIDLLVLDNQRILLEPKDDNFDPRNRTPEQLELTTKSIIKYPYFKDLGAALSKLPTEAYEQFIDLLGEKQFLIKTITEYSGSNCSLRDFLSALSNQNEETFLFLMKNILGKEYFLKFVNERGLGLGYVLREIPYPIRKEYDYKKTFIDFLSNGQGLTALIKDAEDLYYSLSTADYEDRTFLIDTLGEDYIKRLITNAREIILIINTLPYVVPPTPLTKAQYQYYKRIRDIIYNIEFFQEKIQDAFELGQFIAGYNLKFNHDNFLFINNSPYFQEFIKFQIRSIDDLISFLISHQLYLTGRTTIDNDRSAELQKLKQVSIIPSIAESLITTIDDLLEFYKKSFFNETITLELIHLLPKEFFETKIQTASDFRNFLGRLLVNDASYKIYKELKNLLGTDFFATKITTPENLGCVLGYSLAALDPYSCSLMLNDQERGEGVITECLARSKISNLHDLNQFINAVLSSATQLSAEDTGTKLHTRQNIINFIKHLDLGIITKIKFIAFAYIKLLAAKFKSFIGIGNNIKQAEDSIASGCNTAAAPAVSVVIEENATAGLPPVRQSPSSSTGTLFISRKRKLDDYCRPKESNKATLLVKVEQNSNKKRRFSPTPNF